MRKKGAVAEFGHKRNDELWRAYRAAIARPGIYSPHELYRMTSLSPTSRFWVSEKRASEVMSALEKGKSIDNMSESRREMFYEIYARFREFRKKSPECSIYEAAFMAVNSPAPKFYLTPKSVRILLYQIKRERKQRMQ